MPKVLYERRGNIFYIIINRPEVRNAVDFETGALITEAYRTFRDDEDALVSIITGAGDKAFCAGADLKALSSRQGGELPNLVTDVDKARINLYSSSGYMGYTRGLDIFKPTIACHQRLVRG